LAISAEVITNVRKIELQGKLLFYLQYMKSHRCAQVIMWGEAKFLRNPPKCLDIIGRNPLINSFYLIFIYRITLTCLHPFLPSFKAIKANKIALKYPPKKL
jgi:hypothetical protein